MLWSKGCGFAGWGSNLRGVVISYRIAKLCQGCQNRFVHRKEARVILIPRQKFSDGPLAVCFLLEVSPPAEHLGMGFPKCHGSAHIPKFQQGSAALTLTLHQANPCGKPLPQLPALEERPGREMFLCSQSFTSRMF